MFVNFGEIGLVIKITACVQKHEVGQQESGQRIDNYLIRHYKGVPKGRLYRAIRKGEVRVNSKRIHAKYKLNLGDCLRLPPLKIQPQDHINVPGKVITLIKDSVIFENEALIVLDKPAGMAVHKGSQIAFGVIEAVRQCFGTDCELVHRLDRGTSGCLLIAKNRATLNKLHSAFAKNLIHKQYICLLEGRWPENHQIVDKPLRKNVISSGERMVFVDEAGKPASTHFKVLQCFHQSTLVEASPLTGRTHQIRVHSASVGCPIAGDDKYGHSEFNKKMRNLGLKRLFLHAKALTLPPEILGKALTFSAKLPQQLQTIIELQNEC